LKDNFFEISLEQSEYTEPLTFTVFDISGKRLVYHKVKNKNGKYTYDLDMSYAAAGIYLVRLGNNQFGKVKKIIVN
jgi:hypothetical protein